MLSWLLPVIVSLPLVPPIFSMLRSVSVSPSWVTMTSVFVSFRVTFTPVGLVKITVSLPAPPSRTLLAVLPTKMSLPVPPLAFSISERASLL